MAGTGTVKDQNTIVARGCLLGNIGCKSQTWTRVRATRREVDPYFRWGAPEALGPTDRKRLGRSANRLTKGGSYRIAILAPDRQTKTVV